MQNLKDFIDIDIFQKIQDDIAEATGFAIITVDYKGKPVTKHSKCSEFCNITRSSKEGEELCERCDSRGGLEAARTGKPYIYSCHKGLVDFAVPIMVNNQYLGAVMAGQILTEEENFNHLENIMQGASNIKDEESLKAYKKLSVIPFEKIKATSQMMYHISNYIVGESVLKMAENELNDKNIKIIEAQKSRVELEKELKAAELKALQSQINPHFLFNVLNSISALALVENAPKTQEVICSLAELLRYTLKKIDEIVFLEDDINYIKAYLKLQKIRFGERLKYAINIPKELNKIRIPFMVLQPFVENSIVHGIDGKEKGGNIEVSAHEAGENLIISIKDDGVGISENKLKIINGEEKIYERGNLTGIGVNNVKQRMHYYYGSACSIVIYSKINNGTEVKITLPKRL